MRVCVRSLLFPVSDVVFIVQRNLARVLSIDDDFRYCFEVYILTLSHAPSTPRRPVCTNRNPADDHHTHAVRWLLHCESRPLVRCSHTHIHTLSPTLPLSSSLCCNVLAALFSLLCSHCSQNSDSLWDGFVVIQAISFIKYGYTAAVSWNGSLTNRWRYQYIPVPETSAETELSLIVSGSDSNSLCIYFRCCPFFL